jgi:kinesin family protein 11
MVDDVLEHQQNHLAMVSTVLGSTADLVDNVITTTRTHLASEAAAAERSKALAHQTAAAEIRRLRAQNDMLTRMLSAEKAKTASLRTDLVQNLTNMIVGFTDAQDASWTQAVEGVKMANEEGMGEMERYGDLVEEDWEEKVGRAEAVEKELQSAQGSSKRQRIDGQHVSPSFSQKTDCRLLGRLLPVYEVDWNYLVNIPGTKLLSMWNKLMDSVDISTRSLLMVSHISITYGRSG